MISNNYSSKSYWEAESYSKTVIEAKKIVDFVNQVDKLLNINQIRKDLMNIAYRSKTPDDDRKYIYYNEW
jgi:hypothetical protein